MYEIWSAGVCSGANLDLIKSIGADSVIIRSYISVKSVTADLKSQKK